MQNLLNLNIFKRLLSILIAVELLSFLSFMNPFLNKVSFFVLILITFLISLKYLRYGVLIVLVELFISSKGYLFFFDYGEGKFPIRIALWVSVMLAWFLGELYQFVKNKKIDLAIYKKKSVYYLVALLFFVLFGVVNGKLNGNLNSNIFNDANAWIYFLLIFPVLRAFNTSEKRIELLNVFLASALWTSIKTLFLFYLFTHNFNFLSFIYKWVRDTGVGEITKMSGGFYRIFFQTHVFTILAFFIVFNMLLALHKNRVQYIDKYNEYLVLSILFLAVNILNFSRSNWLGMIFGFLVFTVLIFWSKGFSYIKSYAWNVFKILFFSFFIFYLIIEFPYPNGGGNAVSMGEALKERTKKITGEAGVSSRWALLPKLKDEIKEAPILGRGFGTEVTYNSSDPRVKNEANPEGVYTTFAFEWGWLDIWIKISFLGFLIYLMFLFRLLFSEFSFKYLKDLFSGTRMVKQSFFIGVVVLVIINFFSPYLNHPLGIGFLILSVLYLDEEINK